MECVPQELKIHILSYLPLKDLCQVALLSWEWYLIATDDVLWKRVKALRSMTDDRLMLIVKCHPRISQFDYNGCKVSEIGLMYLCVQCWPTLTHLTLRACDEVTPDLIGLVSELCVNLTLMDLSCNLCVDDSYMCQLACCHSLKVLRISCCDSVTDLGLSVMLQNKQLMELDASYLLGVKLPTIENLIEFSTTSLQHLLLDGGNLTDHSVARIQHLTSIRRLQLQYCDELTDEGMTPLSSLKQIVCLKLYRCFNLTSDCVSVLTRSFSFLRELCLSDCSLVDDRGLVAIGSHCAVLQQFDCSQAFNHYLTDVGMCAVLLGCPNLEELVLKGLKGVRNFVTLLPVLQRTRMKYIHLGGCQNVSNQLLENVAAFCPKICIFGSYANEIQANKFLVHTLGTE